MDNISTNEIAKKYDKTYQRWTVLASISTSEKEYWNSMWAEAEKEAEAEINVKMETETKPVMEREKEMVKET